MDYENLLIMGSTTVDNATSAPCSLVVSSEEAMEIRNGEIHPIKDTDVVIDEPGFHVSINILSFTGYESAYDIERISATTIKNYENWLSGNEHVLDLNGYLPTKFEGLRTGNMALLREATYLSVTDVVGGPEVLNNPDYVRELRRGLLRTGGFFIQYSGKQWDDGLVIDTGAGLLWLVEAFRVSLDDNYHIAQYVLMSGSTGEYDFAYSTMLNVALQSVHAVFNASHNTLLVNQSHIEPVLKRITAQNREVLWFFMLPAFGLTFIHTWVPVIGQVARHGLWAVDGALNSDRITMTSTKEQIQAACDMFATYYRAHDTADGAQTDRREYIARGLALTLRSIIHRLVPTLRLNPVSGKPHRR
jgi:hypothetical protein